MEYLAALTAEAEEEVECRVANGLTAEERERRELENRADAGDPPHPACPHGIIARKNPDFCETDHWPPASRRRSWSRSSMARVRSNLRSRCTS